MRDVPGRATAERRRAVTAKRRDQMLERARARRDAQAGQRRANLARARGEREASLVDLLDRLIDGGVVVHGDITLAVADVDLVYVGLRALIASVESVEPQLGTALPSR